MNPAEYFEKNRYIYLSEVLSKDVCKNLTQHMHDLHKEGKLVQDEQCPLSWSVYGDPTFDGLLEKLAIKNSNLLIQMPTLKRNLF